MFGGLPVLQSVNRLIHKQKVSLIQMTPENHWVNKPLYYGTSYESILSTCTLWLSNRGRGSQIQSTRKPFAADHLKEDEVLPRIY